jgi:hypothetical protein
MKHGMHQFQDIWSKVNQTFLTWDEARIKFNLEAADYPRYNNLVCEAPCSGFNGSQLMWTPLGQVTLWESLMMSTPTSRTLSSERPGSSNRP